MKISSKVKGMCKILGNNKVHEPLTIPSISIIHKGWGPRQQASSKYEKIVKLLLN